MALMNESWLGWVAENLQRNCNPEEILGILLKQHFPLHEIRAAMGAKFPVDSHQLQPAVGPDYKMLSEFPLLRLGGRRDVHYIANAKMQLVTVDHLLTGRECDALVKIIDRNLRPSTVTVSNGDDRFRTSYSSDLSLLPDEVVKAVDQKIADALGIRLPYSEGIQGQKYEVGEEFKAHTDFFEPGTEEYRIFAGARGNRTWTCMVYLKDTPKGGGTHFVHIDKMFYPKKGLAVAWNNLTAEGLPNRHTTHHGMPVEQGQKYIITKWFREKGAGEMFEG